MSVRLYDISRTLFASMAVWPGDTSFELRPTGSIAKGDIVNVTTLTLSAHTGTQKRRTTSATSGEAANRSIGGE